jgi:hypothetical protein|tara:strand:+ start:1055 stop:1537 length:483 start_codon:yes stop_codon:yes gene_type:complete
VAKDKQKTIPPSVFRGQAQRAAEHAAGDAFLAKHFQFISPEMASSFTPEQRVALRHMFMSREEGKHLIDSRHSFPLGRRRYYYVFLFGRDKRPIERLRREGMLSRGMTLIVYLIGLLLLMLPVFGILYLFKSALGVDLFPNAGGHEAGRGFLEQIFSIFG